MSAIISTPNNPLTYQNWAGFYGGNVNAPPPPAPSVFGAGANGAPPMLGAPLTGGWTNPQTWANYYAGAQGFAPQGNSVAGPSGALAAEATNNPNSAQALGWEQDYGNPANVLQNSSNWADSLGPPPTNGNYQAGWTNPSAWAAYYSGSEGFTAPAGAGTPAAALSAAAALSHSNPNDPNLQGWMQDFGSPGYVLANTPNWASSLGNPQVDAQGIGVPQDYSQGVGAWESPLAWAAYYGGQQGYPRPVDNTLQAAQNFLGIANPNDPSLLGWELDYGNPQTVISVIEASPQYQAYQQQIAANNAAAQQAAAAAQAAANAAYAAANQPAPTTTPSPAPTPTPTPIVRIIGYTPAGFPIYSNIGGGIGGGDTGTGTNVPPAPTPFVPGVFNSGGAPYPVTTAPTRLADGTVLSPGVPLASVQYYEQNAQIALQERQIAAQPHGRVIGGGGGISGLPEFGPAGTLAGSGQFSGANANFPAPTQLGAGGGFINPANIGYGSGLPFGGNWWNANGIFGLGANNTSLGADEAGFAESFPQLSLEFSGVAPGIAAAPDYTNPPEAQSTSPAYDEYAQGIIPPDIGPATQQPDATALTNPEVQAPSPDFSWTPPEGPTQPPAPMPDYYQAPAAYVQQLLANMPAAEYNPAASFPGLNMYPDVQLTLDPNISWIMEEPSLQHFLAAEPLPFELPSMESVPSSIQTVPADQIPNLPPMPGEEIAPTQLPEIPVEAPAPYMPAGEAGYGGVYTPETTQPNFLPQQPSPSLLGPQQPTYLPGPEVTPGTPATPAQQVINKLGGNYSIAGLAKAFGEDLSQLPSWVDKNLQFNPAQPLLPQLQAHFGGGFTGNMVVNAIYNAIKVGLTKAGVTEQQIQAAITRQPAAFGPRPILPLPANAPQPIATQPGFAGQETVPQAPIPTAPQSPGAQLGIGESGGQFAQSGYQGPYPQAQQPPAVFQPGTATAIGRDWGYTGETDNKGLAISNPFTPGVPINTPVSEFKDKTTALTGKPVTNKTIGIALPVTAEVARQIGKVTITNPVTGQSMEVPVIDIGPNQTVKNAQNRGADLTPAVMKALGLQTDQRVQVTWGQPAPNAASAENGGPVGQVGEPTTSQASAAAGANRLPPGYPRTLHPDANGNYPPILATGMGSGFGEQRPGHIHQGDDILAPAGTPMYAVRDGTIVSYNLRGARQPNTATEPTASHVIRVQWDNGSWSYYMHGTLDPRLRVGSAIHAGEQIGTSGVANHVAHLHFEIHPRPGAAAINPATYYGWNRLH